VKKRLGERASSHSRLLYLADLVHRVGRPDALVRVRAWERCFWEALIGSATVRPGARELLVGFRARGGRVAITTDLTLEVQLWKLEAFGLAPFVDALAASEEVPSDKPATELFLLGAERIGVPIEACVVVGDSPAKDGEGARRLGLRYLQSRSTCGIEGGLDLHELAKELIG
jgi:HAD superfamily hydrolase (TIGR01549 family)